MSWATAGQQEHPEDPGRAGPIQSLVFGYLACHMESRVERVKDDALDGTSDQKCQEHTGPLACQVGLSPQP